MRSIVLAVLVACEPAPPAPIPSTPPPTVPSKVGPGAMAPAPSSPSTAAFTPKQLIDAGDDYVGKDVTVDIREALFDADHSSIAPTDGYSVMVKDVGPARFTVLAGLPKNTHAPLRIHGRLTRGRLGLELSVSSWSALARPAPEHLAHAGDIVADPAKWSNKFVEVEDVYVVGFEASYLGAQGPGKPRVWVDYEPDTEIRCEPKTHDPYQYTERRVRVTGTAYTGKEYGHLGGSEGMIVAHTIEYLPCPAKP